MSNEKEVLGYLDGYLDGYEAALQSVWVKRIMNARDAAKQSRLRLVRLLRARREANKQVVEWFGSMLKDW